MAKDTATHKQGQQLKKPASPSRIDVYEEMEHMFDRFFPRAWMRRWGWPTRGDLSRIFDVRLPNVDVIDRDNEIVVKVELPGVNKKDIDVSVTEESVTIKGSTSYEEKEEKDNIYRSEISRGEFMRTIALPAAVDGTKATASFKNGMLELVMPKTEIRKRHPVSVE